MRTILFLLLIFPSISLALPDHYDELIEFVQEAPDQGSVGTCLFMASTGAMELLLNKKENIQHPVPYGKFDLAEAFLIWAPKLEEKVPHLHSAILRFNLASYGVHALDWPFESRIEGQPNRDIWRKHPELDSLPKIPLPEVEALPLFELGNRWSTHVLSRDHVEMIKEALWTYQSPVLINYNDSGYWHVIMVVGYDDRLPGACHDTNPADCEPLVGSFYVRDSFGVRVELRDYDWFRLKGNAASVVRLKPDTLTQISNM
jgi:hypothetical protein